MYHLTHNNIIFDSKCFHLKRFCANLAASLSYLYCHIIAEIIFAPKPQQVACVPLSGRVFVVRAECNEPLFQSLTETAKGETEQLTDQARLKRQKR